ncbi:hypothetical protein J3459_014836 [Metarhizium acridum]|nr:hypothetical protein J3459_014836 [Metarhizium acridum]
MSGSGYDAVVDVDDEQTTRPPNQLTYQHRATSVTLISKKISNSTTPTSPIHRTVAARALHLAFLLRPRPHRGSSSSKRFLWTISFYSQFFDVDTSAVLSRCWAALYPRANFLDVLEGNPDLYGPFWIATTVVLILFLGGTISDWLSTRGTTQFAYDFRLLSALFLALRYFGSESANLLECWALYGYSNLIWIPVAIISWSPIEILNWTFVALGFGLSVAFLLRNLYPVLSATDRQVSKVLLIIVVILHAGLSITIKILFFAHNSPVAKKPAGDDVPASDKPAFLL